MSVYFCPHLSFFFLHLFECERVPTPCLRTHAYTHAQPDKHWHCMSKGAGLMGLSHRYCLKFKWTETRWCRGSTFQVGRGERLSLYSEREVTLPLTYTSAHAMSRLSHLTIFSAAEPWNSVVCVETVKLSCVRGHMLVCTQVICTHACTYTYAQKRTHTHNTRTHTLTHTHTHTHTTHTQSASFPRILLFFAVCTGWPWHPLSSFESTPVSILVLKQVDWNMCRFSKLPFFFSSDMMTVIDWWNGSLTLGDFSLRCACCYLLEVSPVALVVSSIRLALSFDCDICPHAHTYTHASAHVHTHTHTHTHTRTYARTHTHTLARLHRKFCKC